MLEGLTPTFGRILVERLTQEGETAGGILIPEQHRETTEMAKVLAVAEDVDDPCVGDTVILPKYPGQEHEIDGLDTVFVLADEVLAVVDDC